MPTPSKPSFAFRAVVAVALLFGFYVLGGVIIAACLATIWIQIDAGEIFPKLILLALVVAGTVAYGMLRSLFMTGAKFTPPGPEITAEEEPALFEVIADVATRMDAKMPAAVYLIPDVNAFVAEVGGFYGFGARRVMGIGVGLLQIETVQQLKATLAHEFGHYAGGDTKLGAFLYRTRASIARVVNSLGGGLTASMFVAYFRFFLRVTQKISRAQELAADEASVRIAGTRAHVQGLRREARAGALFGMFVRNDLLPLANAGFRPNNFYSGFRRASKELAASGMRKKLDQALAKMATDEFDTHPALPERIEYAEALPVVEMESDDRLARTLLRDPAATEKRVGNELIGRLFNVTKLESISWKDVGGVFGPKLAARAEERRKQMAAVGIDAADLLQAAESAVLAMGRINLAAWVRRFEPKIDDAPAGKQAELARTFASNIVAMCLGAALVARGGSWVADPGREVEVKEGDTLHPVFSWATDAAGDPKPREELLDRIRALRAPS